MQATQVRGQKETPTTPVYCPFSALRVGVQSTPGSVFSEIKERSEKTESLEKESERACPRLFFR